MARIRSQNTKCELRLRSELHKKGLRFQLHRADLAGKPDIVFPSEKVAVFVDGDFWHGWRFSRWKEKLSEAWRYKIEGNIVRDRRNIAKLRRQGWQVVRVWEHEVFGDSCRCVSQIETVVRSRRRR
jgi:DNA mismatch endonuclease (patch repair protein)